MDVFNPSPLPLRRFEPEADVRPVETAIADGDVARPAVRLAADDEPSVPVVDHAVRDDDVLARRPRPLPGGEFSGLEADSIVSNIHQAIIDNHSAAGTDVDPVSVLCIPFRGDGDVANHDILALHRLDMERGGVRECPSVDQHIPAIDKLNHDRAEKLARAEVVFGRRPLLPGEQLKVLLPLHRPP